MCPPLYYRRRREARARALSQWRGLYRLLRDRLEVQVDLLEPRPDLPGLAHVARGGFVAGDTFIAGRSHDAASEPESEPLENFFLVRGYDVKHLAKAVPFEGQRDIVACGGTLFTSFRASELECADGEIEEILGTGVVGLQLADHWQRSLAACLCPIGGDQALFCPSAFTHDSLGQLESRIPRLVPVEGGRGGAIICDSLVVGKALVMAEGYPAMHPTLEKLGLTVYQLPLEEYGDEGVPKSLALQLR